MRVLLFIVICFLSLPARAKPITVENSTSPDGKYYLALDPAPNDYEDGAGALQIRSVKDKKVMGSFEWRQYDPHISSDSAVVLWKPDSRAFAITWYMAQGWTGSQVYAQGDSGWMFVPIPKFRKRLVGQNGWVRGGKGQFVAVEWMPDDVVKMRFEEGLLWNGLGARPDASGLNENDWVYLRLVTQESIAHLQIQKVQGVVANPGSGN